jgi:hypothetical protein
MAVTDNGRVSPAVMLSNMPWATLLTWGVLLLVIYTLHELFFIIFVTFLLAYMVRSLVTGVAGRIRPGTESPALERWLTLAVFAILLLLVWGVFSVLGSRFIDQSRTLLVQAQRVQAEDMLDSLLSRTVGAYLFQRTYGGPDDPRYQSALAGFQAQGRQGEGAAMSFARLRAELQSGFELDYEQAERQRLGNELRQNATVDEGTLTAADEWQRFTASPQYQAAFERYFEQRRRADPVAIPYDYPTYLALSAARTQCKPDFSKEINENTSDQPEQGRAHLQQEIEQALRRQLARQWWNSNPPAD